VHNPWPSSRRPGVADALLTGVVAMMMQSEAIKEKEAKMSPEELAERAAAKKRRAELDAAENARREAEWKAKADADAAPYREARRLRFEKMKAKGVYGSVTK